MRNWDSILEKKRANLRSISEPARLRQPPPQKHGSGTRKRAGSKHTGGATNSRPSRAFCPLVGLGYAKAFTYLNRIDWDCPHAFYLLGKMYCNGLGVPENIAKGVEYLQKAGDYVEVKEELRHYKKTLFGKWVRR